MNFQQGECQNTQRSTLLDKHQLYLISKNTNFTVKSDGYIKYFCLGWWCPPIAAMCLANKFKEDFIKWIMVIPLLSLLGIFAATICYHANGATDNGLVSVINFNLFIVTAVSAGVGFILLRRKVGKNIFFFGSSKAHFR